MGQSETWFEVSNTKEWKILLKPLKIKSGKIMLLKKDLTLTRKYPVCVYFLEYILRDTEPIF